ncbi:MAG TPA: NUDIX hydrolase [Thermoanaerobaculia bacterium]
MPTTGAMMAREVNAVPAASLLVLRGTNPFEVLMLLRHERSSFAPGAWVFPGGMLEDSDVALASEIGGESEVAAMRIAAVRETFEETGVWIGRNVTDAETKRQRLLSGELSFADLHEEAGLDLERLVLTSRWITPEGLPKRFDTWFFVATVDDETVATPEEREAVEVRWVSPSEALEQNRRGKMPMIFPTLRNLEAIAGFARSSDLIDARRGAEIHPIMPVLVNGRPTLL